MDEKTEQPKWCKDGHKASELQHGIILDDDGYVFRWMETFDMEAIDYLANSPFWIFAFNAVIWIAFIAFIVDSIKKR